MTAQVIAFPDRRAILERRIAEVEKHVEAWMARACPDWLVYSEDVARWAVDPPSVAAMLREFEAAGGRVAYEKSEGHDGFRGVCAELAAEFLEFDAQRLA